MAFKKIKFLASLLGTGKLRSVRRGSVPAVAYLVIWYAKEGIVEKTPFDAEKESRTRSRAGDICCSKAE